MVMAMVMEKADCVSSFVAALFNPSNRWDSCSRAWAG